MRVRRHSFCSGFARLAAMLHVVKGRFLLSINDVPEVRTLFAWADIAEVTTKYSVGRQEPGATVRELLIGRGLNLTPAEGQARLL